MATKTVAKAKKQTLKNSIISSMKGYSISNKISNVPTPTYSKLEEIRDRVQEREKREKEEQDYNAYKERYKDFLENSIDEIDTLLDYFLNKCETIVEKDYDSYIIRKDVKDKNNISHIYLRVSTNGVVLQCENNNLYDTIELIDNTLYVKYEKLFEMKFFEYLNRKTKRIVDEIQDVTKLNRKSKITRMIEDSETEEE